ncbi:uncharacterized protein [Ptychodera flava]|uniref:uncharacterized protein n=1 Tax=Ptychodera flava TaxID=63121 RepID=UPI003969C9BF
MSSAPTQQMVIPAFGQPGQVIQSWQQNQIPNQPAKLVLPKEFGVQQMSSQGSAIKPKESPNVSSAIALPKKQGTSDSVPNLPRRSPRRHSSKIHENEGTDSQEKIPVVMPATSVSGKVAIPRLSRPIGGRILIQPLQPHRIQAARTRQTSTALQQIKPKPIETASSQEKRVVVDMKSMMKVREVSLLFQDKPQGVFASPVEVRPGNESVREKKKLPRRVTVKDLVAHKNSKRARLDESVENSKTEEDDEQVEDEESSDQGEENATEPQNTVVIDGKPREIKLEPASPPTEQVTDTQGAEDVKKDSMEEEVYIGVSIKEEKKDDDADVKPEEDVRQENDGEEKKQSDEGEKDDVMKSQDKVENLAVDDSSQKEVVSEEKNVKESDHTLKRRYRVIAPKPVAGDSFSDSEEDVSDVEEGEEVETNRPEGLPKTTKVRKNPIRHADGQLECEECGRLFKSIRNYNRHYPSHIDDKRFKCTICSKTFHLSYHLKEHMNKHYDLRPYKCHLCGKAYNHSGTLSGHLKMAHKNESIPLRDIMKCTYCCKVFAYEGTYYKHLEDRHNVTVQRFYTPPTPGSWQTVTSVPVGLPRGRLGGNKKNIPQTSDAPTELPVQNYQYVSTEGKSDKPHINPLPQRVSKKRRAMRLAGKLRDEDERTSEGIPIIEKVGIPNSFALMQQPYYQNDPKYRAILPRPTIMANQSLDGKVATEPVQLAQPASDIGTQPGTAMAIQSSVSTSVPVSTTSPAKVVAATASSVTPVTSSVSDSTTPVQSTSTEFTCNIGDSAQTDASSIVATSAVPQSPSLTDSVLKQEDEGTSQDTDTEDQIIESSTKPKENTVTIKQRHYSCHYCPVSFSTKLRLSFHVTKEHSSRPMNSITHQKKVAAMAKFGGTSKLVIAKYRCVLCLYFFRDLPTLRRHISNFHRCVNPDMFVADIIQEQEDLSHRNALECYSASTGRKLSTPRSVSAEPESESESKADSNDNREVLASAAQGQSMQPPVDSFPKCHDENKILSSIIAESRHVDVKKEKIVSTSDSSSDTKIHVGKEPITGALSTSNQLVNSEKSQLATSQQAFDGQSDQQKGEASVPYVGQTVIGNQPSAESNNQTETSHNTMLCLFPLHCAKDNIFNCRTVIQQCPMCNWTFICKVRKDLRVLSVNSLTVKHMCPSCMQRFEYGFAHMDDESDFFCRKCCPQSRNKRKPKRYVVVDGTVREDSSEEDENDKISENSNSSDLEDTSEDRISPMGIVGVESFPFECKKCKVKFYEEVDTNKVLCTTCNKFVTRASLREHTQVHEFEAAPKSPPPEEATVEPDKCRICYRKVKDFETHMKMSHRTIHDAQQELKHQQDTGIYSCSQCNQAYLLRGNLHRHINMYHSNKSETEKCQVAKCGKVFQSASHLEMHMKNTHNTETNIQDQEDTQSTT